jgi:two-component system sensor histidine kinase BaeS
MTWDRANWPRHRFRRGHAPPPFVRRLGCLFIWAIVGTAVGVWLLARSRQLALAIGIELLLVILLSYAFFSVLRRVTQRFREQDALRRRLMADVAHELRTPLTILQGRIEGLIDGVYPLDDRQRLEELLEDTKRLGRLVEDVRTIANAEAGALALQKETFDLAELVRDVAGSFERKIDVDVPDELTIDADPLRIREVLLNILTNADRHTPADGRVSIHTSTGVREVTLRVSDSGSGIAAEDVPRIFDRFYKGSDSRGSGLGLAITRDLVLAHGGTIDVISAIGEGTTITLSLPR